MPEARVAIEHLRITSNMVAIYEKTTNTIKITLPNLTSIMFFKANDKLVDLMRSIGEGYVDMTLVGECKINDYNGYTTAQIAVVDYEVNSQCKYVF